MPQTTQHNAALMESLKKLHVGESKFEGWFANYVMGSYSTKQLMRDAYAAGMEDPLVLSVLASPAPQVEEADLPPLETWQRITKPGQVNVGTKLRFTIGDDRYSATARLILDAGTDREEIIYNKRQNYYLITSMAIENKGSQKNVEFLSAAMKEQTK
jgi:hypothetical protein